MRAAIVSLIVAAAFLLGGCQYLLGTTQSTILEQVGGSFDPGDFGSFDPNEFGSFDPNEPAFSLPPPLATFKSGTATVTIDGKATTLGKLTGTAATYEDFGTDVSWTDGKGLYLRFGSAPEPGSPLGDEFVLLDWIHDGQHWTSSDPTECPVKVDKLNTAGLSGSASCTGLHWIDAMSMGSAAEPAPIPGEPAFDVAITFEAKP